MTRIIVLVSSFFCFGVAIADDIEALLEQARSGDIAAQFQLSKNFGQGIGTKKDPEQAKYWLSKAAENGYPEAQYMMGENYFYGRGDKSDHSKALEWYEKSANQDHLPGQFKVGYLHKMGYLLGGGGDLCPNLEKSIYWYQLTAEKGHMGGLFGLGCFKYFGVGVTKDQDEGESLIRSALNKGHKGAQRFLENKGKADDKALQKICDIYPDIYAREASLGKTLRTAPERKNKIVNIRIDGSLASKRDIGCIGINEVKNSFTPADLYKGVSNCLAQEKLDEAAGLFVLAGLYARYDAARVTDKTASQARNVLIMNTFSKVSPDVKAKFSPEVEKYTKEPSGIKRICEQASIIGPPDYYPEYMILHGMNAFMKKDPHEGAIATDFDKSATWDQLLTDYLHCKAIPN